VLRLATDAVRDAVEPRTPTPGATHVNSSALGSLQSIKPSRDHLQDATHSPPPIGPSVNLGWANGSGLMDASCPLPVNGSTNGPLMVHYRRGRS
jgi:hypothetical protein